jgi:hypothetical protein
MLAFSCWRACAERSFGLAQRQALLIQFGLRGKVLRQQLFGAFYIDPGLGYPAPRSVRIRASRRHLQRFLGGVELQQRLAALDMAAHFHHPGDDLARRAESELAFVTRADLARIVGADRAVATPDDHGPHGPAVRVFGRRFLCTRRQQARRRDDGEHCRSMIPVQFLRSSRSVTCLRVVSGSRHRANETDLFRRQ